MYASVCLFKLVGSKVSQELATLSRFIGNCTMSDQRERLNTLIKAAVSKCQGDFGVLRNALKCEHVHADGSSLAQMELNDAGHIKTRDMIHLKWTFITDISDYEASFERLLQGGDFSNPLVREKREHTEVVARRLDKIFGQGIPLPQKLFYIRRCERRLRQEIHQIVTAKTPRSLGVRSCGSVECRVLGLPSKPTKEAEKVCLFGGRPHLILAPCGDRTHLACASLDNLRKVRCGELTEEDLVEVCTYESDVENPMADEWVRLMKIKTEFKEALDDFPEEVRALHTVARWWSCLHPNATAAWQQIGGLNLQKYEVSYNPDPWQWPRDDGAKRLSSSYSIVGSDTLVRCFFTEAWLIALILPVLAVVVWGSLGSGFWWDFDESRQKCNESSTKVRRKCDGSATKVQQHCNKSATQVRRKFDEHSTKSPPKVYQSTLKAAK